LARFAPPVSRVVMAYLGVQYAGTGPTPAFVGTAPAGLSWWCSLEDLDRWAREHPTHQAIFGAAMKYLSTLGPAARLRLHHEVTVAKADEQYFEYLGCHPQTGMLRALEDRDAQSV
jgi:hypothetical protein